MRPAQRIQPQLNPPPLYHMPNVREEEEAAAYQPRDLNPEILDEFVSEEEYDRAAMPPLPPTNGTTTTAK